MASNEAASGSRRKVSLRASDVLKLAMIAAFEHHMKFDGNGYPGMKRADSKQHIVSQADQGFFLQQQTARRMGRMGRFMGKSSP